ncbi:toll-like receptor 21 [Pristis pectinata]|uniref:toll-like receptor 21 n=1 Tax=Pristis pectinata TaxID=685728 RepID=UPI00223C8F45|nr:toll-like receptor 21 [Pristis pectinata]XP_051901813.1 toll-like receptor 21 [Pristis pectinata]XP_051901814.1 toll-like receptor 21 [Pristis pectinata]
MFGLHPAWLPLCVLLGRPTPPVVLGYSYRNCQETPWRNGSFQCVHRFLTRVSGAVSDLPPSALHLNISHNQLRFLGAGGFRALPNLLTLRLDYNQIREIDLGAFGNLSSLVTLNLSYNLISRLRPWRFQDLHSLAHLLLQHNQLLTIEPNALETLGSLQTLYLNSNHLSNFSQLAHSISGLRQLAFLHASDNKLSSLQCTSSLPPSLRALYLANNSLARLDGHPGLLSRLLTLDLADNQLASAVDFARLDLRGVQWLVLSRNPLNISEFLRTTSVDLKKVNYSGLRLRGRMLSDLCWHLGRGTMSHLVLRDNQISSLSSLEGCPPVVNWDLSRNVFTSINCLLFDSKRQAVSFTLEHNRINHLVPCVKDGAPVALFPNLTRLSLRYNRIFTISGRAFAHAPNLLELMLNINNVAVIERGAFSDLASLRFLRLDNNLLTDIYNHTFGSLGSLRQLNLRNNRISVVFSKVFTNLGSLDILDLGGNKIRRLSSLSFYGLKRLSKLYLDRNYISRINQQTFSLLPLLGVLDLERNWIRYNSAVRTQRPFVNLTRLRALKLQAQQPYGINIIPPGFFNGLVNLEALYIGENKMSLAKDVFRDLVSLRTLSMPDACNGIHSMDAGAFRNLRNLLTLNLENVGLRSTSLDIVGNLSRLKVLLLGKNAIQVVNSTVLGRLPALSYLDVRKNPLTCTCGNTWFVNWSLSNPRTQVTYFYNHTCADWPKEYLYRFDARVCYLDVGELVFQVTLPFLLVFTFGPVIYAKKYWHIKYGFYIFRSWLRERWAREAESTPYKFDAFVSYNSRDEDWVLKELVPSLEVKGPQCFRLCLHHRDFELGKYIVDNIVDSIYQSRKTLCVMTRSYLSSEWCSMELQLASYRLFHELKDVLVLVFLEHIPESELSTYHRMRRVMRKQTYIQWPSDSEGQKLFWVKVREAIKGSSVPEKLAPSGEP